MVTLGAGLAPASFLAGSSRSGAVSLEQVSFEAFASRKGAVFFAYPESGPSARLRLIRAERRLASHAGARSARGADNEQFSLLFRLSDGPALQQDTYEFEHPGIGRFAMFIVPVRVGNDPRQEHYEAIFNRSPC